MNSLAHVLTMWEDVLARLRRESASCKGNPLSERDMLTFTEAIVMCALHLADMSTRHDGIGSDRILVGWAQKVVSIDVYDLGSFLSEAITLLRHISEPSSYGWFKRQLSKEYPFAGTFLSPIKTALADFLCCPDHRGFYVCYQFLSFLTHLTLLDIDVDLEGEYEELEAYLRDLHYPESIVDGMNSIMCEWMEDFSISEETFFPKHGPGAVAELSARSTQLEKYRCLGSDALIDYVFSHYAGIDVDSYFPLGRHDWERESKVVFVPKSMKTRRTISKEPATLMYLQQGVSSALVKYIHSRPSLSSHIDLRDQARNAVLAVESSATQKYATIDLSSASDTVSTRLVKSVFRGTPVYPYLVALRSRTVALPSGKVLETAKYAPMGSALCFPVESLIFACAVEYAVRRARRTNLGYFPSWRVYGDDILVQDALFWDVMLVLEGLGFIPNLSKSFSSPARFRESCGGEGYDGYFVTPMRISRRFRSVRDGIASRHAAEFEGLIDMANSCYEYQFSYLRAWIIRVLLGNSVAPPLFSGSCNGTVYSPWPDNFRARSRMNFMLWRSEVQVGVSRPKPETKVLAQDLERARLYETLRLTHQRSGDMFVPEHRVSVPRGSGRPRIQKRWVERPTLS